MSVYVIVLAVLFNGETLVFEYGNRGATVQFSTKAECEEVRAREEKTVPGLLASGGTAATLKSILCVERKIPGA